ncbi:MAG: hypothetical protein ACRC14_04810 [Paracoccaceae bacterium]
MPAPDDTFDPDSRCRACNGTGYTTSPAAFSGSYGDVGRSRSEPCFQCAGTGSFSGVRLWKA